MKRNFKLSTTYEKYSNYATPEVSLWRSVLYSWIVDAEGEDTYPGVLEIKKSVRGDGTRAICDAIDFNFDRLVKKVTEICDAKLKEDEEKHNLIRPKPKWYRTPRQPSISVDKETEVKNVINAVGANTP